MQFELITDQECEVHYPFRGRRITPLAITVDKHTDDDVLETQYSDLVVTDAAKRAMTDAHLTGFSFKPAVATGAAVREVGYWEVQVKGFAGFMRPSFIQGVQICQKCGHVHYDTSGSFADFIDARKWDSDDMFTIWPFPNTYFMSARFVDELKSRRVRGFHEENAAQRGAKGATPYDLTLRLI